MKFSNFSPKYTSLNRTLKVTMCVYAYHKCNLIIQPYYTKMLLDVAARGTQSLATTVNSRRPLSIIKDMFILVTTRSVLNHHRPHPLLDLGLPQIATATDHELLASERSPAFFTMSSILCLLFATKFI